MKNIIIIAGLLTSNIYADLSMDQIRTMVKKIHDKREGISMDTLENTQEPFVRLERTENNVTAFVMPVTESEVLSLNAIVNKRAYINDQWRSIDDNIGGFILKYVGEKGVVLRNENQIKKLFLHERRDSFIKIKEGN